jgi:hypothetical protein
VAGTRRTGAIKSQPFIFTVLAVSCDAPAPTAQSPVQIVEIAPASGRGTTPVAAPVSPRRIQPLSASSFPESCRASAQAPKTAEAIATADLPIGSLSVRVMQAKQSDDDVCLATLTDARGAVIDCKTFADEGCDLEAPVAYSGHLTVEGVCITERCAAVPERSRRIFEVFAASPGGIEVRAVTGDVVQECVGE